MNATCAKCPRRLVDARRWKAIPLSWRHASREHGYESYKGRGLCAACYAQLLYAGELADFERVNHDHEELLEDWTMLRDEGYTVRTAAPRLGVTVAALDKALCRAKQRGDQRGQRRAFGRAS